MATHMDVIDPSMVFTVSRGGGAPLETTDLNQQTVLRLLVEKNSLPGDKNDVEYKKKFFSPSPSYVFLIVLSSPSINEKCKEMWLVAAWDKTAVWSTAKQTIQSLKVDGEFRCLLFGFSTESSYFFGSRSFSTEEEIFR